MTKETLIRWLDQCGHSNEWLAEKCQVKTKTVSSWRSDRPIPAKAVLIIRGLMDADEAMEEAKANPKQNLVLEFDNEQFSRIETAAKFNNQTTREWAKEALMSMADKDFNEIYEMGGRGEVPHFLKGQANKPIRYKTADEEEFTPSSMVADAPDQTEGNGTEG